MNDTSDTSQPGDPDETHAPSLSIVIPALNAAQDLPSCVAALKASKEPKEIIVVDGGSADETMAVAQKAGAKVIASQRGRGLQLKAGAEAATGDWLLFLHGDTVLGQGWETECRTFMSEVANQCRAAAFTFALDDASDQARRVERMVAWRCEKIGLPYGDQGLLIRRDVYTELGGFKPLPLMEDVDLVRRIGKDRIHIISVLAVTSAERYRRHGWWARPSHNLFCLFLYICGLPPRWIAKLYG